jgi:hypothetical protein
MKPQGNIRYAIDYDRPCHIKDHLGDSIHRYLDETPSLWRNPHGAIVQPQPQEN